MSKVVATISVRCCGSSHRVGLLQNGTFCYFNHDSAQIRRYRLLAEIGGEVPTCLKFTNVFDEHYWLDVPGVKDNSRFVKAARRIRMRRCVLMFARSISTAGERKSLLRSRDLLGPKPAFGVVRLPPKPCLTPTKYPSWVPTYLKPLAVYRLLGPRQAWPGKALVTRYRFKTLHSRAYKSPKAKVYWSDSPSSVGRRMRRGW